MFDSVVNSNLYNELENFLIHHRDSINSKYHNLYHFQKNMGKFDYFVQELLKGNSQVLTPIGIRNWKIDKIDDYYYFYVEYGYYFDIELSGFASKIYQVAFNSVNSECFFSNLLVLRKIDSFQVTFMEQFDAYLEDDIENYLFRSEQEGNFRETKTYMNQLLYEKYISFIRSQGTGSMIKTRKRDLF
ncbi:MAG: hypothetical protein PUB18_00300 [bacterium]|nr:hypothetical protein [bacterium]